MPSLGNTNTGSTSYPATNVGNTTSSTAAGFLGGYIGAMTQFTTTMPYTVQSLSLYVYKAATGKVRLGIYNDSGGSPSGQSLLGQTGELTFSGTGALTGSLTSNVYLAAGTYWLAMIMDTTNSDSFYYTSVANSRYYKAQTYGALPDTFPTELSADQYGNYYFYAVCVQIEGYVKAYKFQYTDTTDGIVQSFSFYNSADSSHFRLALYSDDGGNPSKPSTLLWESGSTNASAAAWVTINLTAGPKLTTNAWYWLCWQWDSVTSGPSYTAGTANAGVYTVQAYNTFPASPTWTNSAEEWSQYLTYLWIRKPRFGVGVDSGGLLI